MLRQTIEDPPISLCDKMASHKYWCLGGRNQREVSLTVFTTNPSSTLGQKAERIAGMRFLFKPQWISLKEINKLYPSGIHNTGCGNAKLLLFWIFINQGSQFIAYLTLPLLYSDGLLNALWRWSEVCLVELAPPTAGDERITSFLTLRRAEPGVPPE